MQHYTFSQIDSWFFRESRSMDGSGAMGIESVFPPAVQTLMGALRAQIGEQYLSQHQEHWSDFHDEHPLANIIGYGQQNYAHLQAQGVWLYHSEKKQLYFPAPANLVQNGRCDGKQPHYDFFTLPDDACKTDLGNIHLPELHKDGDKRDKPIENSWLSADDYTRILRGTAPEQVIAQKDILTNDLRLGIARDYQTRRTEEGMIYQTKHLRLHDGWKLYLGLDGTADGYTPKPTILRLGGEARMAALSKPPQAPTLPEAPENPSNKLVLYLLTPLPDPRTSNKAPPLPGSEFELTQNKQLHTIWRGELAGITVNIVSAIVGKLQRIGGWDIAKHHSTPVRSYLPAGSCWYLECADTASAQTLIDKLHLQYLTAGTDRALGYGQIAIGLLPYITA